MRELVSVFQNVDITAHHELVIFGSLDIVLLSVLELSYLFLNHFQLLSLVLRVNSIVTQLQNFQKIKVLGLQN